MTPELAMEAQLAIVVPWTNKGRDTITSKAQKEKVLFIVFKFLYNHKLFVLI